LHKFKTASKQYSVFSLRAFITFFFPTSEYFLLLKHSMVKNWTDSLKWKDCLEHPPYFFQSSPCLKWKQVSSTRCPFPKFSTSCPTSKALDYSALLARSSHQEKFFQLPTCCFCCFLLSCCFKFTIRSIFFLT